MGKIKDRNYFVSYEVKSNYIFAFINLKESFTNNEVHVVCNPGCNLVSTFKVGGIEYDVRYNEDIYNIETNRRVKSSEKIKYLKGIVNHIIAEGNDYIRNTFGNITKEIVEIYEG